MKWIYATATGSLQSAEITQFLTVHGVSVIAQGSPVVEVTGDLINWQALGRVDQPFVAPANIGWLRIPLSSVNLAPSSNNGWETPAPITVSLYSDVMGSIGTLITTTVIPAEQIESVQLPTWPEPQDVLFGPAVADAQSSLPQLPGVGWAINTSLVAGAWGVLFATQGATDTQMWVVPYNGSDLGGWIDGSTLPVSGLTQAVYAPTAQAIVVLSGGALYAATFAQTGVAGSWQQLPAISGVTFTLAGILTYEGQDYLVAVGSNTITYTAPLSSSGSIGARTAELPFPVSFSSGNAYQVGADLVMIVQVGGVSKLISMSTPSGGWTISGSLTASSNDVLGVIGQAVITTNGTTINATTLTELGTAPWSLPVPINIAGANLSLLAFASGTEYVAFWLPTTAGVAGLQQPVYLPSWVSVPFPEALTVGNTYHLVLSASEALTVGVALPVVTPASGPNGLIYVSSSWQPLGGAIPLLIFYAAAGAPYALIGTGKTTLLWFDAPSGALTTTVELVGGTSESRVMSYADGVLSEVA